MAQRRPLVGADVARDVTLPGGARQVTLEAVRRMAGAIVHRGPDDEGLYAGERAVIGMRRLSIIDLAGGAGLGHPTQPSEGDTP